MVSLRRPVRHRVVASLAAGLMAASAGYASVVDASCHLEYPHLIEERLLMSPAIAPAKRPNCDAQSTFLGVQVLGAPKRFGETDAIAQA
jgi:hypothetical protein